jgi:TetR/AcrR family transcriptional regulator
VDKVENTKDKILAVAANHFADFGFEGTRMDKIAKDACVNKASIYYNIGNKETLYAMVLNNVIERGLGSFFNEIALKTSAEEKLESYIRHIAGVIKRNSEVPRIIMREQLSGGKNLPESFAENIAQMLDLLSKILEQGNQEGIFHAVDTVTIHFMIFGTILFQMTTAPIRKQKQALSKNYGPEPGLLPQSVVENVIEYVLRAVKKEK